MKRIHIFSIAVLVTTLFFSGLNAYGHSPCSSENEAVNTARNEYDRAKENVKAIQARITAIYIKNAKGQGSDTDGADLSALRKDLEEAKEVKKTKSNNLQSAENVRDNCLAHAYRTCGCATHHTESLTSCGCSYNSWNGWCHCPASS